MFNSASLVFSNTMRRNRYFDVNAYKSENGFFQIIYKSVDLPKSINRTETYPITLVVHRKMPQSVHLQWNITHITLINVFDPETGVVEKQLFCQLSTTTFTLSPKLINAVRWRKNIALGLSAEWNRSKFGANNTSH